MTSSSLTSNQNYLVTVTQGGTSGASSGLQVVGNAMLKLSFRIQNKWVNIMEAIGLSGDSGGLGAAVADIANIGLLATGNNFLPEIATSHVWRGSTGIELLLQFRFDAVDNTAKDVLAPVQTLLKMFTPIRGGSSSFGSVIGNLFGSGAQNLIQNSFLHPPGPTPYEYITGQGAQRTITAQLGRVMNVTNLIPADIDWEFEHRYATSGDPISALVTITMFSYTLPDQNEILNMFVNQATQSVEAANLASQQLTNPTPGSTSNPANSSGYTPGAFFENPTPASNNYTPGA